jgi:hypothetical protein
MIGGQKAGDFLLTILSDKKDEDEWLQLAQKRESSLFSA